MLQSDFYTPGTGDNMTGNIYIDSSGVRNFIQVQQATQMANKILRNDEFYLRIALQDSFDLADAAPETIAVLMRHASIRMYISLYHALSQEKNFDGYDDEEHPSIIHLNIWKMDRSPASICNTIIHSCVHAVNAQNNQYYFGHGDNSLQGKENTAPYWIGALAQKIASSEDTVIIPMEHDHYEPRLREVKKKYDFLSPAKRPV